MRIILALLLLLIPVGAAAQERWVAFDRGDGLILAGGGHASRIVTDPRDHEVVRIAAADLARDIETVSGARPAASAPPIWAGTLGRNAVIDGLVASGKLDLSKLKGAWEGFVVVAVDRPMPGVPHALVVVGSDRRGTAYGLYELSRAIGVSPWHWWADVTPTRRTTIRFLPAAPRFDAPDVKYRGLFINDEDWALIPWAATTHAPEEKPLGPKSYARVFELLLRLRANLLWPAMHKSTAPFNSDPANAALADRYAIVMGSSHAEPMLRNNVGEWTAPGDRFDYVKNADGVRDYWRARVDTNAKYESVWTLGMRGIHDSGMVGPTTTEERRVLLEKIFTDQRCLLTKAGVPQAPQVFTPYKEVLDIYRAGLRVPDNVTLMWPNDNFGYIRQFPNAAERKRAGGSGVYYHLSYLGAPLAYLWLSTTPPALIREEMSRAWDLGARQMWVVNAGDIKPAELGIDYFMQLAWDVEGTRERPIDDYFRDWAGTNIDPALAKQIAPVMAEHHRLNFARRPEHLQWWLPHGRTRASALPTHEIADRMTAFERNLAALVEVADRVPAHRRDAFFQLVGYPVEAAARANERVFAAEAHDRLRDRDFKAAMGWAARANAADARIAALTRRYNEEIAGGKWRGMMAVEPADGQWRSYRAIPVTLPAMVGTPTLPSEWPDAGKGSVVVIEAERATGNWRRIDGLGRNSAAIGSRVDTPVSGTIRATLPPGKWRASVEILPTYADRDGEPLRLDVTIDGKRHRLTAPRNTGDDDWKQAVLDNRIILPLAGPIEGGSRAITLSAEGGGMIVDRLMLTPM